MKTTFVLVVALLLQVFANAQQLSSPAGFLGYAMGEKFTPHHRINEYVKQVAQAVPARVKVETYGKTYEGRELLVAIVSSKNNMQRLEEIRQNNLALAGLLPGRGSRENAPAIVWLSYNVHGNEPSSSEAAMQVLHTLADTTNAQVQSFLQNTVVIIDPCLNPDGRDRYVNWYTSVAGLQPDAYPFAREHNEPAPGGRSNHYNFDLNRDWAWQTQAETRQRVARYQQWMPHVHVDFHEQFINSPYFFAPAAEPFHEVITPWQREFQTTIGKNNAKYFDENGWLYFTKEHFDLFYPAYGDTYPTYSGAIGMTYEQAGHGRAGLAIATDNGDTLTLTERVQHHFTTSISTIEVAAGNAKRLVNEFGKFFEDSRNGVFNTVKTYVLTSDNPQRLDALSELLQLNGISYGTLANTGFRGLNYQTQKTEAGKLKQYHIAVSSRQPRSVLASVLLDASTALTDTNTYDITAWSLPYAYGVDAYAVSEHLAINPSAVLQQTGTVAPSSYGYLVEYSGMESAQLLGDLLQAGVRIRFAEQPVTYNGKVYNRGTLIILVQGNVPMLHDKMKQYASKYRVNIQPVSSGMMEAGPDVGSSLFRYIKKPKVALITGNQVSSLSAGQVWHLFEQELKYPITLINATDLRRIPLNDFTTIIFPDGNHTAFGDNDMNEKLRNYAQSGGKIIAIENAVAQMAGNGWDVKPKETKAEDKPEYAELKVYANRFREGLSNHLPGAIYRVHLDETHPLAFGLSNPYYTLKTNPAVYSFLQDGWNVGYFKKDNYVTGFAGNEVRKKLVDGLNFGVQDIGRGSVIYMVDDPLFRQFWHQGKLLFANAVFLVGQ